ncbi:hypothetical protein Peur_002663 [Populus x canadensis]
MRERVRRNFLFKSLLRIKISLPTSLALEYRSTLLRFVAGFKADKQDEQFETNKAQVVKEIVALEPRDQSYDMREIGCCLE